MSLRKSFKGRGPVSLIEKCLCEPVSCAGDQLSFSGSWKWLVFGLTVLVIGMCILEVKQPYYFVKDDSFAEFLPITLQGCRALMRGVFLEWSPYQFMGFPVFSTGSYILTYPVTYISYAIARYLLGHELFTLDVFCIMHLIAGYFVTYLLLRRNKVHSSLAMAGSLSFVLSGYSIIAGRSWLTMITGVVWVPLFSLAVTSLREHKHSLLWIISSGFLVGIFYHGGHTQMWVYSIMFFLFSVLILLCAGKISFSRALLVIPALLLGLALAMPLFILQWRMVVDFSRAPLYAGIPFKGLAALLFPFPLVRVPHPEIGWGTAYDKVHMTPFYYSGTLFTAVFFGTILVVVALLIFKRGRLLLLKRFVADNVWLICALVALLCALGNQGVLWTIQSKLPLFSKFRMPFKFLLFFNIFAVLGSSVIINRCLCLSRHSIFWRRFLGIAVCCLMLYHTNLATASFYSYADRPDRLQLPKVMHDTLGARGNFTPWRILSICPIRSPYPGYFLSLKHNFPTMFDILAFDGYDPLVENSSYFREARKNLASFPLEAAQAYGIRWVIVDKIIDKGELIDRPSIKLGNFFLKHGVRQSAFSDYVLLELKDAQPIVFAEGYPQVAMPLYLRSNGLDIDVLSIRSTGGRIVINMLWRPEILVSNGKEKLKCISDRWGRVVVEVLPGTRIVSFRYNAPWKIGFTAGGICLLLAILSYFLIHKIAKVKLLEKN